MEAPSSDHVVRSLAAQRNIKLINRYGQMLVRSEDVAPMLDAMQEQGCVILGIEGFWLDGDSITPQVGATADYSRLNTEGADASGESIRSARAFFRELLRPDLCYEFTVKWSR
jgi:hypothetical protein